MALASNSAQKMVVPQRAHLLNSVQLQYLPVADTVVVIQDGHIVASGTYEALVAAGIDFHQYESKPQDGAQEEELGDGEAPDHAAEPDPAEADAAASFDAMMHTIEEEAKTEREEWKK